MEVFDYHKTEVGDYLSLTSLNSCDQWFNRYEEGVTVYAQVLKKTDFMMTIKLYKSTQEAFLADWFEETGDEFHSIPTAFNPQGVKVKFKKLDRKDLPRKIRWSIFLGKF